MAENAPPANAPNGNAEPAPGMPHYERLRRDLRESLQKKRAIDATLAQIEETILQRETAYLEETTAGNIIRGFDNYIKGTATTSTAGGAGPTTRRKVNISDADRIFSRTSSSLLKEASTPGSTQTTPSHAPTPTSSFPTRESSQPTPNGPNRNGVASKKKKAVDDDDSEGKPAKRGKITYGRD